MGQATGSALASCLYNCLNSERNMPISVIRGRGAFLSFMVVSFSDTFLQCILDGKVPRDMPAEALVFPRQPTNDIHGFNLLEPDGRRKAFEALVVMREFVKMIQ